MKKKIIVACILCFTCFTLLLSGCASSATQTDSQTKNRQYMASVNQIMETIKTDLTDFSTVVKSGEVVSLNSQLTDVNKQVEALKALEVPEAMTDINSSYSTAATELQTALTDYVELYQSSKSGGSLSADKLAEIQSHYDAGIAALKDADTKVAAA